MTEKPLYSKEEINKILEETYKVLAASLQSWVHPKYHQSLEAHGGKYIEYEHVEPLSRFPIIVTYKPEEE